MHAFANKTAALLSTSPGALGGLRGLIVLRMLLSNINVHVLPKQIVTPKAFDAFIEQAQLKDDTQQKSVIAFAEEFVRFTRRLAN